MGYPDLKSDETIVLTAQQVKVKSVPFELVLTNRRLIIIDSEKSVVPTQQIPLITIRNVTVGENAIRDPVITLTILTDTADTREMALTFAMQTAGERKREAGEWVKALKKYITDAVSYPVDMTQDTHAPVETRQDHTGSPGIKKKIEIARPIKKIMVETSHMPPKPVETTSLPEGSFCGRCGNRMPPGSTFCNRCGTKVAAPTGQESVSATPEQITTAPASTAWPGDHRGRPIEQIIHSIEPLIEDSVPRTEATPAIPEPEQALYVPAEVPSAPAAETTPAAEGTPAPGAEPASAAPAVPPASTSPPLPPVPAAPRKKRSKILAAAIIIIVIIAVAAGGFMVMKNMQKSTVVTPVTTTMPTPTATIPTAKPTPVVTTIATTAIPTTPQVLIPQTGVWVEVTYDKTYTGQVGTPGSQVAVTDTGDHFYIVPTSTGTVAVSLQKTDGSGDELKVTVYSAGTAVKTVSTTTPMGRIELQFALATPTTAEITTLPTTSLSSTASATANTTNSTA
ncbi:MAG: zinc ribbon domain-containing protein [Methanoregula sp.]|jgi:hypothetical protein